LLQGSLALPFDPKATPQPSYAEGETAV
jgi:hypothetical protein